MGTGSGGNTRGSSGARSTGRSAEPAKPAQMEASFRAVFEGSRDAIGVSKAGIHVFVNPAYLELFGFPPGTDLAGKPVLDLIAPESRDQIKAYIFRRVRTVSVPLTYETRGLRADGSAFDMEVTVSSYQENGEDNTLVILRDITERKRAEKENAERGAMLQQIMDTASVAIGLVDKTGRIIHANRRMAEMFRRTLEELVGCEYVKLIHPSERATGRKNMLALLASEIPSVDLERLYWRKDGTEFWGHLACRRFYDVHGSELGLIGVITDITKRKQAEEALRTSELRYRAIVDSQAEFVVRYQPGGVLTFVNDTLCKYTNMKREDLLGRSYYPFLHPDDREAFTGKIEALDRNTPVMVAEARVVLPDGREAWHQWTHHAIFSDQGDLVEYQCTGRDVTELKNAEARIKESEKKYRTLFESSSDGIFILDLDGNFIDANAIAYQRLGYTKEELLSLHISKLDSPKFADRLPERFKQLREWGAAMFESGHRRKDGSVMPVEVNSRLLDFDGRSVYVSVVRDITERKRAEEEISERGAMLQQILDTSSVAIFLVDKTGRITQANRRMAEMFGYALEDLPGKEYVELVHPAERETGRQKMLALLASEIPSVDLERHYWRMDGTEFWGHLAGRRFYDVHGTELGLIGVISDNTERKRAEEALRLSEVRFRAIIENASVGILVADVETRMFRYANPEICRLLGYSEQDFHSLTAMDLAVPEELPASIEGFQAHAAGSLHATERTFRRKDGSAVRMSISSVRMEFDGRPCLVGFFSDITEKRLLEEERLKAQKLESIGTLAGGIAHDFNNLLQGIFGYISMAKLTIDQRDKSLAMLGQAEKALHQSVNLTSQLLTFSKGGKPVKRVVDLREVIENAVKFALSGSRVTYDISLSDDLCAVEADAGQIGQVVQNIVLNAMQAMPLGGRIEIAARNVPSTRAAGLPLSAPDGLVEIVVRDRGTGIPPEHLPRIFDPYFTTKEKGSGLGLATSYSVVKNHDGMFSVSSEMGKGSTFTVYLPASRAAQEQAAASPGRFEGRKGRVLVMDDEAMVRVVAGELLRELGHEAEFAEHGDAAIEKFKQAKAEGRPFDVIILDLTIRGGKGGAETLRELLEIDPGVRAVVSSGYSDDEVVATYRQHGFHSFLKKPYDIQELGRVLNDMMA